MCFNFRVVITKVICQFLRLANLQNRIFGLLKFTEKNNTLRPHTRHVRECIKSSVLRCSMFLPDLIVNNKKKVEVLTISESEYVVHIFLITQCLVINNAFSFLICERGFFSEIKLKNDI